MKRHEKLALLTKVVQGNVTDHVKHQLRQSVDYGPIIAIVRAGHEGPKPDDQVTIQEGTKEITMLYKELDAYAAKKADAVMFVFPHNGRD